LNVADVEPDDNGGNTTSAPFRSAAIDSVALDALIVQVVLVAGRESYQAFAEVPVHAIDGAGGAVRSTTTCWAADHAEVSTPSLVRHCAW
jgi:hypothetical protein